MVRGAHYDQFGPPIPQMPVLQTRERQRRVGACLPSNDRTKRFRAANDSLTSALRATAVHHPTPLSIVCPELSEGEFRFKSGTKPNGTF
jgi:hypothetical protein